MERLPAASRMVRRKDDMVEVEDPGDRLLQPLGVGLDEGERDVDLPVLQGAMLLPAFHGVALDGDSGEGRGEPPQEAGELFLGAPGRGVGHPNRLVRFFGGASQSKQRPVGMGERKAGILDERRGPGGQPGSPGVPLEQPDA